MRNNRTNPLHIALAFLLMIVLAIECVVLVRFVKKNILADPQGGASLSAPNGDLTNTPTLPLDPEPDQPSQNTPVQPEQNEPDTPVVPAPSDPADPEPPAEDTDPYAARAQQILTEMTTWEKVCQMFIITPESLTTAATVTRAGEQTQASLAEYPVGGLVYFAKNLESPEQVLTMIANTQEYSELDLFIAVDEEGGIVNRLMDTLGTTYINSMFNYRNEGTLSAHDNAMTIGSDIKAYGFNVDFAPVADVWSNPENTVIGRRAYSDDFEQAAELIKAAVEGFHDAGMICTLKHFPGHGDTAEDSHYASAYVSKTKEELQAQEWLSFQAGIDAGADMVMIGHLSVPALDDEPATVSDVIVTDILRGELGFDGVVITDSLEMSSVSELYDSDELAVRAIEAGIDILLEPQSFRGAVDGVMRAIESGRLSEERINESVERILILKLKYGIIE